MSGSFYYIWLLVLGLHSFRGQATKRSYQETRVEDIYHEIFKRTFNSSKDLIQIGLNLLEEFDILKFDQTEDDTLRIYQEKLIKLHDSIRVNERNCTKEWTDNFLDLLNLTKQNSICNELLNFFSNKQFMLCKSVIKAHFEGIEKNRTYLDAINSISKLYDILAPYTRRQISSLYRPFPPSFISEAVVEFLTRIIGINITLDSINNFNLLDEEYDKHIVRKCSIVMDKSSMYQSYLSNLERMQDPARTFDGQILRWYNLSEFCKDLRGTGHDHYLYGFIKHKELAEKLRVSIEEPDPSDFKLMKWVANSRSIISDYYDHEYQNFIYYEDIIGQEPRPDRCELNDISRLRLLHLYFYNSPFLRAQIENKHGITQIGLCMMLLLPELKAGLEKLDQAKRKTLIESRENVKKLVYEKLREEHKHDPVSLYFKASEIGYGIKNILSSKRVILPVSLRKFCEKFMLDLNNLHSLYRHILNFDFVLNNAIGYEVDFYMDWEICSNNEWIR